jgi:hypothetical protein
LVDLVDASPLLVATIFWDAIAAAVYLPNVHFAILTAASSGAAE